MTGARLLGSAIAVMLVFLISSAAAGAGGRGSEPPKPAHDWPTTQGLAGVLAGAKDDGHVKGGKGDKGHGANGSGGLPGFDPNAPITGGLFGGSLGTISVPPLGSAAPGSVGATTLVLYDTTGSYGWLGELYATAAGNLASHFGAWKAEPVASYQQGQISQYTATIYLGSTYDEPLPTAFLDDVYNSTHPVIWVYDNIWQLTNRYTSTFQAKYGWMWWQFDTSPVSQVVYKGATLTRDGVHNGAGIMQYSAVDTTKTTMLAQAVRANGTTFPWALRTGSLTYIGENPFVYTTETDRVIAFEDLLYDALNPAAQPRHRVVLRLEDISPYDDPATLKAITDYLRSQRIPFGFQFTPVFTDPNGVLNNGVPQTLVLARKTAWADAIRYAEARGGTLVGHGLTHQYSNIPNPFTAVTGDDAEFYRLIYDPTAQSLTYAGPVPADSPQWAANRMDTARAIFAAAGVGVPDMWSFPDYAASAVDYQAAAQRFNVEWGRALYFGGVLSGGAPNYSHSMGQAVPYVVRDVYGSVVLPENSGSYEPDPFYSFPTHTIADILAATKAELAVRDGVAGFFYHPFQGVAPLQQIVDGIRAQGWTFVSPTQLEVTG
jgi:uncharacterized protein YdaL